MLGAIGMEMNEGGDIWSTGIFSYESPLKDLLDRGNYTLEELLAEDELLQELRSNEPLVEYFASPEIVRKLLSYVVKDTTANEEEDATATVEEPPPLAQEEPIVVESQPPKNGLSSLHSTGMIMEPPSKTPGAWLTDHLEKVASKKTSYDDTFRHIRFPYMACEVICSELPKVLDALVAPDLLDILWSLVVTKAEMDDYRAGYFEKILNVLFRRKPDEISEYLNHDSPLFTKTQRLEGLIHHLNSHSILQITQQLLLPERPQPDAAPEEEEEPGDTILAGEDDTDQQVRCEWSDQPHILQSLLNTILSKDDHTAALNAAEVVTAVVQNSLLSSDIVLSLCSDVTIQRLVDAAVDPETFVRHESRNTIAMNVLENIVLQLGGYGSVGTMTLVDDDGGGETGEIADLTNIISHLHRLLDGFTNLLRHESTQHWKSPTQFSKDIPQPILGTSRLKIVRVVESLILLGDPSVDAIIVQQSRCLECCLDFFWEFQWCSMLHQSVANLLVHAFEGQNLRSEIQEFILVKCNLMERLMDSFAAADESPPPQKLRYGYMGHVIIVCQALVHAYSPGDEEDDVPLNQYNDETAPNQASQDQASVVAELIPPNDVETQAIVAEAIAAQGTSDQSDDGIPRDDFGEPLVLFELVFNHRVAGRWLDFVENILAVDNAMQVAPLGGYPVQAQPMMQRPGLVDEGFMMGDDGDGPPAPPTRLSEVLEMDDSDLDVAVSMIDELNIREDGSSGSGSSGDTTTEQRPSYVFDDPLGKADRLGLELNKLQQQLNSKHSSSAQVETKPSEDDSDNGSSSDEEPENPPSSVPVMDLFTGNFNYDDEQPSAPPVLDDFANFANFDAVGTGGGPDTDNDFGPFATFEEKSKFDDVFGEGDHADLLENDDEEEKNPVEIRSIEDPFESFDDAVKTANRIFDENETIASLAEEATQILTQVPAKDAATASLDVVSDTAEQTVDQSATDIPPTDPEMHDVTNETTPEAATIALDSPEPAEMVATAVENTLDSTEQTESVETAVENAIEEPVPEAVEDNPVTAPDSAESLATSPDATNL